MDVTKQLKKLRKESRNQKRTSVEVLDSSTVMLLLTLKHFFLLALERWKRLVHGSKPAPAQNCDITAALWLEIHGILDVTITGSSFKRSTHLCGKYCVCIHFRMFCKISTNNLMTSNLFGRRSLMYGSVLLQKWLILCLYSWWMMI